MISMELANLEELIAAVEEFQIKSVKKLNVILRGSVTEFMRRVLSKTPVRTGRLKGGWRISVGGGGGIASELGIQEYAFGLAQRRETGMELDKSEYGRGDTKTLERARSTIMSLDITKGDATVTIYNNVRYARYVEYGEGPGRRVAHLMLTSTIAEWPSIVASRAALGGKLGGYGGGE